MTQQYRALQDVGRFSAGDILCELPKDTINRLLAQGLIKLVNPESEKQIEPPRSAVKTPSKPSKPSEHIEDLKNE